MGRLEGCLYLWCGSRAQPGSDRGAWLGSSIHPYMQSISNSRAPVAHHWDSGQPTGGLVGDWHCVSLRRRQPGGGAWK